LEHQSKHYDVSARLGKKRHLVGKAPHLVTKARTLVGKARTLIARGVKRTMVAKAPWFKARTLVAKARTLVTKARASGKARTSGQSSYLVAKARTLVAKCSYLLVPARTWW
jgi:hypothetical protein